MLPSPESNQKNRYCSLISSEEIRCRLRKQGGEISIAHRENREREWEIDTQEEGGQGFFYI